MAAPKIVVSPIDPTMVEKTDWSDPKSVNRYFASIGSQMTSGQVWANIAVGYFHMGEVAKASGANAAPDVTAPFNAYRAAAEKRTGKPLTDKTAETYKSVGQTLATIGYSLSYSGESLVKFFAEKGSMVGGYGSRAAAFTRIADHFKSEPTFDEVVAFAKTFKSPATLSDDVLLIQKSVVAMINEDHDETIANDEEEGGLANLQAQLVAALDAFVERAKLIAPPTPSARKGKVLSAAAQKLAAKREAQSVTTH